MYCMYLIIETPSSIKTGQKDVWYKIIKVTWKRTIVVIYGLNDPILSITVPES